MVRIDTIVKSSSLVWRTSQYNRKSVKGQNNTEMQQKRFMHIWNDNSHSHPAGVVNCFMDLNIPLSATGVRLEMAHI